MASELSYFYTPTINNIVSFAYTIRVMPLLDEKYPLNFFDVYRLKKRGITEIGI
jgi:hypothetical protein